MYTARSRGYKGVCPVICTIYGPKPYSLRTQIIFSTILGNFLKKFNPELPPLCDKLVNASIEVYLTMCDDFRPTPAKVSA